MITQTCEQAVLIDTKLDLYGMSLTLDNSQKFYILMYLAIISL